MRWPKHYQRQSLPAPENVGKDEALYLAAIKNQQDLQKYPDAVATEFATENKADRLPIRNLGYKIEHLRSKLADFDRGVTNYTADETIQNDLNHIVRMAKLAMENMAPAYFCLLSSHSTTSLTLKDPNNAN